MLGFSPMALRSAKEVLDRGIDAPLYSGIELERKAYAMLRASHDFAEGVAAFGEKRTPSFTGRGDGDEGRTLRLLPARTRVDEAVDALAGGDAKVLAGGQSLVPVLAMRLGRPGTLVDITRLPGLDDAGGHRRGAADRRGRAPAHGGARPRSRGRCR